MTVTCVANTNDVLGEVPRWHAGERALYWVDTRRPAIQRPGRRTGTAWMSSGRAGSRSVDCEVLTGQLNSRSGQLVAPLITGFLIAPSWTPHLVRILV